MPPWSAKKSTARRTGTKLNYETTTGTSMKTSLEKTPHRFKPFHDYPKSPSYLKEENFGWSRREGTAPEF